MRVAFMVHALELGGAERQLVVLARALAARGHDVLVVTLRGGAELEAELDGSGVRLAHVARSRWWIALFPFKLPLLLRRFGAEVVHSYMPMLNVVATLVRPLLRRRTRLVFGVRGIRPDINDEARRVRSFYGLEAHCSRFADAVIANSEAARAYVVGRGFPPGRVHVVRNGIDVERFRFDPEARERLREEWGVADDELLVGQVANLRPVKDHPTFLHAAAEVAARRLDVRFVCVGENRDGRQAGLERLAAELGLADRLVWAGPRFDVPAVMSAFDLLVVASYAESSPNVIGEAMACGTPCVSTDVGDAALLLGGHGVVVPPRSPADLAEGIEKALAGGARRDELAAVARRGFSVDAMVERAEAVMGGSA